MEVGRRRIGVVAWTVVVVIRIGDVEKERPRHEVEQDRPLHMSRASGRADGDDVEDTRPAGHGTSMLNEPSAPATVELSVVAEFSSVLVADT